VDDRGGDRRGDAGLGGGRVEGVRGFVRQSHEGIRGATEPVLCDHHIGFEATRSGLEAGGGYGAKSGRVPFRQRSIPATNPTRTATANLASPFISCRALNQASGQFCQHSITQYPQ
jgi:hypothetical protein